jgi:hypothetical protein
MFKLAASLLLTPGKDKAGFRSWPLGLSCLFQSVLSCADSIGVGSCFLGDTALNSGHLCSASRAAALALA